METGEQMTTCRLCGTETAHPCGPLRGEVCHTCWLAIGADDDIAIHAADIEQATDWAESDKLRKAAGQISEIEMFMIDINDNGES